MKQVLPGRDGNIRPHLREEPPDIHPQVAHCECFAKTGIVEQAPLQACGGGLLRSASKQKPVADPEKFFTIIHKLFTGVGYLARRAA